MADLVRGENRDNLLVDLGAVEKVVLSHAKLQRENERLGRENVLLHDADARADEYFKWMKEAYATSAQWQTLYKNLSGRLSMDEGTWDSVEQILRRSREDQDDFIKIGRSMSNKGHDDPVTMAARWVVGNRLAGATTPVSERRD